MKRGPIFDPRTCAEPGCGVSYTPSGPNAKYCPEHSDARLRKRGNWRALRERSRRRVVPGSRCECCGAPASGPSYHGVVCCEKCYTDAQAVAREWLLERAS